MNRHKVSFLGAALLLSVALTFASGVMPCARAQTFNFSDIKNWTGNGSNQAAMVIDWHDGKTPESLAFGYRWSGSATGMQMLQAIEGANTRLFYSTAYGGAFVYSFGYDLNGNGGTFTPGTPGATTETGSASDPADHYAEGVFTKFWGYDTSEGSPYGGGGAWSTYPDSAGNRPLLNGSWDGWSLSFDETNFTVPDPGFPAAAAVPEPGTWALVCLPLTAWLLSRARRGLTPART